VTFSIGPGAGTVTGGTTGTQTVIPAGATTSAPITWTPVLVSPSQSSDSQAPDVTLTAATGGYATTSATLRWAGPVAKLAFTTQPPAGVANTDSFGVAVTAQDAGGNPVDVPVLTVGLAVTGGTAGLTCQSGNSLSTSKGVATFTGCRVDKVGSYTLTASAAATPTSPAVSVQSSTFTVASVASKLAFRQQPFVSPMLATWAGLPFPYSPVVLAQKSDGTTADVSVPVTFTLVRLGGATGTMTCTGANPATTVHGVATLAGCSVNAAGSYQLTASSPGLGSVTSATFGIVATPPGGPGLRWATGPTTCSPADSFADLTHGTSWQGQHCSAQTWRVNVAVLDGATGNWWLDNVTHGLGQPFTYVLRVGRIVNKGDAPVYGTGAGTLSVSPYAANTGGVPVVNGVVSADGSFVTLWTPSGRFPNDYSPAVTFAPSFGPNGKDFAASVTVQLLVDGQPTDVAGFTEPVATLYRQGPEG
jgi:hypothetical protein